MPVPAPYDVQVLFDVGAVPEPGTYVLMLAGLAWVAMAGRRRSARS